MGGLAIVIHYCSAVSHILRCPLVRLMHTHDLPSAIAGYLLPCCSPPSLVSESLFRLAEPPSEIIFNRSTKVTGTDKLGDWNNPSFGRVSLG